MPRSRRLLSIAAILSLTLIGRPIEIRGDDKKPEPGAEVARLRLELARKVFVDFNRLFEAGEVRVDDVAAWSMRLLDSQLATSGTDDARMTAHKEHLARMEAVRGRMDRDKGSYSNSERLSADYYCKEAQYLIAAQGKRETGIGELKKTSASAEAKVLVEPSRRIFEISKTLWDAGELTIGEFLKATLRLLDSEILSADSDAIRRKVFAGHLARMKTFVDLIDRPLPRGCKDMQGLKDAHYCYLEAQYFVAAPEAWKPQR